MSQPNGLSEDSTGQDVSEKELESNEALKSKKDSPLPDVRIPSELAKRLGPEGIKRFQENVKRIMTHQPVLGEEEKKKQEEETIPPETEAKIREGFEKYIRGGEVPPNITEQRRREKKFVETFYEEQKRQDAKNAVIAEQEERKDEIQSNRETMTAKVELSRDCEKELIKLILPALNDVLIAAFMDKITEYIRDFSSIDICDKKGLLSAIGKIENQDFSPQLSTPKANSLIHNLVQFLSLSIIDRFEGKNRTETASLIHNPETSDALMQKITEFFDTRDFPAGTIQELVKYYFIYKGASIEGAPKKLELLEQVFFEMLRDSIGAVIKNASCLSYIQDIDRYAGTGKKHIVSHFMESMMGENQSVENQRRLLAEILQRGDYFFHLPTEQSMGDHTISKHVESSLSHAIQRIHEEEHIIRVSKFFNLALAQLAVLIALTQEKNIVSLYNLLTNPEAINRITLLTDVSFPSGNSVSLTPAKTKEYCTDTYVCMVIRKVSDPKPQPFTNVTAFSTP